MDWGKYFASDAIDKGLISKIYKQLLQSNTKKDKTRKTSESKLRRPGYTFFKEVIQMVIRHMKGCSILIIIREMQIKTTVRFHLILIRMAIIKKPTNDKI